MALDAAWVMLGSGERRYEELWRALAARYPDRVSATIGFDERLAHLIEAGADMFLMPSRFEPCGLNQMYSLRYGTVPIVRATGGLNDTVVDVGRSRPDGHRVQVPRLHARGAGRGRPPGAGGLPRPGPGRRSSSGACSRTIPGTFRPGSMSKCIEQC